MPREKNTPVSQPIFDESQISPDPSAFKTIHDPARDKQLYAEIKNLLAKDVVSFDKMRGNPSDLYSLETIYGPSGAGIIDEIKKTGRLTFHAAGDTGASTDARGKYRNEITVADQMAEDCHRSDPLTRPRFFYHLGDVVYNFCEPEYWYDQFYEPYRNYPAPILAIPTSQRSGTQFLPISWNISRLNCAASRRRNMPARSFWPYTIPLSVIARPSMAEVRAQTTAPAPRCFGKSTRYAMRWESILTRSCPGMLIITSASLVASSSEVQTTTCRSWSAETAGTT